MSYHRACCCSTLPGCVIPLPNGCTAHNLLVTVAGLNVCPDYANQAGHCDGSFGINSWHNEDNLNGTHIVPHVADCCFRKFLDEEYITFDPPVDCVGNPYPTFQCFPWVPADIACAQGHTLRVGGVSAKIFVSGGIPEVSVHLYLTGTQIEIREGCCPCVTGGVDVHTERTIGKPVITDRVFGFTKAEFCSGIVKTQQIVLNQVPPCANFPQQYFGPGTVIISVSRAS